jgi:tRNA threonylcarbamoyladenosine biosynthesis protein TsaE
MKRLSLTTSSPDETERLGRRLGELLSPGMFVALCGELGGGKTCFTRGVVSGAAPESAHLVASPTFAIMNEYPGTPPIHHFDFYRFSSSLEIAELGFEEYFLGQGICLAEWAERLDDLLPQEHLTITFQHGGEERRIITMEAEGAAPEALLERLAAAQPPINTLT